ncbi:MAG: VWA domain-containing protein [Planctomycetota bacterium]|nr:VWA domain-containing protein [Planctomycetota bacterium]
MPSRPRTHARRVLVSMTVAFCLLAGGPLGSARAESDARTAQEAVTALKRALKKDDLAQRKIAVRDVGRLCGHLNRAQQLGAAKVLRKGLEQTEDDPEVRRLMVRALARMAHEHAWIPVILTSTDDRHPAVKAQARQEVLSGGADELKAFAKILANETSASFRAELLLMLRDRRKPDAAPLLLERLGDKSRIVQAAAAEALEAVSGEAHGYDVQRWKAWHARWLANRPKEAGPSVSTGGDVPEPPPHISRSLRPDFYGLRLTAKDIVFVVDISGSVGSGGFGRAKKQIIDAVSLLGSDVHVAALFFSDKVHMWKKGAMVPASPLNKEDLILFLRGLEPGRSTDVYTSLNAGLAILDHRVKAKQKAKEPFREPVTMITVSDGRDNMAALPPRVVADKLDRLDPALTVLHSIVLGSKPSPLMKAIATRGGGHCLYPKR